MPLLLSTVVTGSLLLAAALVYLVVHFSKRTRHPAQATRLNSQGKHSGPRVLWDIKDDMARPAVRDGVLYIDRRSVLVRGFSSILTLVGIVAVGRSAGAVSEGVLSSKRSRSTVEASGDHFDVPSQHSDSPHYDTTPHSDGGDGNGGHIDENQMHQDQSHNDGVTPHTDNPNG